MQGFVSRDDLGILSRQDKTGNEFLVSLPSGMLSVQDISIRFGGTLLFSGISFHAGPKERIGLIGTNGSGKSTLLRIIAGEITPDTGKVTKPGDLKTGYLPQRIRIHDTTTVFEEAASALKELNMLEEQIRKISDELSHREDYHAADYLKLTDNLARLNDRFYLLGGESRDREITRTLHGLGFRPDDMERSTTEFSGGWRMRIELAKILLQKPSLLLLDEPTNHLDIESIQWLEDYFMNYQGTLILVSHDKALLDHITHRTLELESEKMTDYPVAYSKAMQLKEERYEHHLAAWKNQQKLIHSNEAFIERFRYKATKAVQVQSRIRMLEKLERIPEPVRINRKLNLNLGDVARSGDIVLRAENISKSYGEKQVLKNVNLVVRRGDRIALVGRNGEGKTTLAAILAGTLEYEGKVLMGTKVSPGYYAQNEGEQLDPSLTVYETAEQACDAETRPRLRTLLGSFLFSGDDIDKKVKVLSGGERSRLALLVMLLRPLNFLILDEPTHHLDMQSKEILKKALKSYKGTYIIVSHDRDFLDGLVDVIYVVKDHSLKAHHGDIYRLPVETVKDNGGMQKPGPGQGKKSQAGNSSQGTGKQVYLLRKQQQRELQKAEKAVERLEEEIDILERKKEELHDMMGKIPDAGAPRDEHIFTEYEDMLQKLENKVEQWESELRNLEKIKTKNLDHE